MSYLQVRERLEDDPAFAAVTVESERIRLFNEHVSSLEVGIQFCLNGSSIYFSFYIHNLSTVEPLLTDLP